MVRAIAGVLVLLTVGPAQSAPPAATIPTSVTYYPEDGRRVRFLSLAEARAIALEQGQKEVTGLNSLISAEPPVITKAADLLHRHRVHPDAVVRVLTGRNRAGERTLVITGIRADGPPPELERDLGEILLNVEYAYWNLYGAYWRLHSREQALRLCYELWQIAAATNREDEAGRAALDKIRMQYELFRKQRLQALDGVMDEERILRELLGLLVKDGLRLVPSDAPTLVERKPDWEAGWRQVENQPEVRIARADRAAALWNYRFVKYVLTPVLRFFDPASKGDLEAVRDAEARLKRAYWADIHLEMKIESRLGLYYRRILRASAQFKTSRTEQEAFAAQLRERYEKYRAGAVDAMLDSLLEAQRSWADALDTEHEAISAYNTALAGWEHYQGNSLAHAHVTFAEEPPTDGEKVRAVVAERRRTRAQVRSEPAVPTDCPLQTTTAISLPGLWKTIPPLREAEALPPIQDSAAKMETVVPVIFTEWKKSAIFPHEKRAH